MEQKIEDHKTSLYLSLSLVAPTKHLILILSNTFHAMSSSYLSQTKAAMQKLQKEYNTKIGEYCSIYGSESAQKFFSVSESKVKYWLRRFNDPEWHSKPRGGHRNHVFTADQIRLVVQTLASLAESHPCTSYAKLANMVEERTGTRVSKSTVRKVFIQNNWRHVFISDR